MSLQRALMLNSIKIIAGGHVEVHWLNQIIDSELPAEHQVISSVPHRTTLPADDTQVVELLGNQLAGVQAIAAVRAEADALHAELATTKQQLAESLTIIEAQRQAIEKLTPPPTI